MIYVASPYSHPDPDVQELRWRAVCAYVAMLMREGYHAFSPVCHSHPIAKAGGLPGDWQFWQDQDLAFLGVCDKVHVLKLDGWRESRGVAAEVEAAEAMGLPVYHVQPVS